MLTFQRKFSRSPFLFKGKGKKNPTKILCALIQMVSEQSPRNPSSTQAEENHRETETLTMLTSVAMVTFPHPPIFLGKWRRVPHRLQFSSTRQCYRDGARILKVEPACPLGISGASGLPFQFCTLCSTITPQKSSQSLSRTRSRPQWFFPHKVRQYIQVPHSLVLHLHT